MKLRVGWAQQRDMRELRERAAADVMDGAATVELCKTPEGLAKHRRRMVGFTVILPRRFSVTYSLERQPVGLCRHMSVSVFTRGQTRAPPDAYIAFLAREMGFAGTLDDCMVWTEDLASDGQALNVLQPVQTMAEAVA